MRPNRYLFNVFLAQDTSQAAQGRRPALVNFHRAHPELFLFTRLAMALEFFDDEPDAVNGFFPIEH
jgi:hypothetical protein